MRKIISPKVSLVIVESPSKCRKIEEYLGAGYKCIASCGHLRELVSLDNIDINNGFHPTFTNISLKQKHINILRKEINLSGEVILATDDDREGEAIAWHICQLFCLDIERTKRIVFHEITYNALQFAIMNPSRININVIKAQHARQILDLLVGFKITPTLWANVKGKGKKVLSAGRCQTPALRLIYDNYKEINHTPSKQIYKIVGCFTSLCILFELDCIDKYREKKEIVDFLNKSIHFNHIMNCNKIEKVVKSPPEPFTTSLLQQRASSELRLSPSETMKICQNLYESGYITYMRTDSKKYSSEFIQKTRDYISNTYNDTFIGTLHPQVESSAHEAIRPTNISLYELNKEEGVKERKLYKLIWKNAIASCMSSAVYNSLKTVITSPDSEMLSYIYKCEMPNFLGWKIIDYKPLKEEKCYNYLLNLKKDTPIPYKNIQFISTMREKIGHYSESKLVKKLEEYDIGRPSTFASLVEKIQDRGYVKKMDVKGIKILCVDYQLEDQIINEIALEKEFGGETGKLVLEPIGLQVVEFLERNFMELFNYGYTKQLENELDLISKGEFIFNDVCLKCNSQIDSLLQNKQIKSNNLHKPEEDEKDEKDEKDISLKHNEKYLGKYLEQDIILKKGKFGLYFVWNGSNLSLKTNRDMGNITIDDVILVINKEKTGNVIRKISESISIRSGKTGKSDYIFFKMEQMKKPSFFSLEGYETGDYKTDDLSILKLWIREKYGIF